MSFKRCVLSFFDNEYQNELKKQCFGDHAFEDTLKKYRDLFLERLSDIDEVRTDKECQLCSDCLMRVEKTNEFEEFVNDFLIDILTRKELIKELFNNVIEIYLEAISYGRAAATIKMKKYIEINNAYFNVSMVESFTEPMFRVRRAGKYDGDDIHELFHVPFDKRYMIGNQRFSLTGIPLLYVAESIPLALKETGCDIRNVNAAVFLPNFYYNYYKGSAIYDITNPIDSTLKSICAHMNQGVKLGYNDKSYFAFKKSDIHLYLARFVLFQILHFPVQDNHNGSFIQEYVLPQLLMDIINDKKWIGVTYHSCKPYTEGRDSRKSYIDKNRCFNVPYSVGRYNDDLLNSFFMHCGNQVMI